MRYLPAERYFTRPLAALIVRMVINTSITPNQITVFSFFLGICGGIFFCGGKYEYFMVGGILAQLSSIFDCADGMLARSRNTPSEYGAFLDLFLDRYVDLFLIGGLATGYFIYSKDFQFYIISIFGLVIYFLQVSLFYLSKFYQKNYNLGEAAADRGLYIFLVFIFSIANQVKILIIVLIILTFGTNILLIANLIRYGLRDKKDRR